MNLTFLKIQHAPAIPILSCGDCDTNEGGEKEILYSATDIDNDSLTCYWYLEGALRDTVTNCNTTGAPWTYHPTYDDACSNSSLVRTLSLVVSDPTARSVAVTR